MTRKRKRPVEKRISERQAATMAYIKMYKRTHDGIPPTVREIQEYVGVSSTSLVANDLRALVQQGKIYFIRSMIAVTGGEWRMKTKRKLAEGEEIE